MSDMHAAIDIGTNSIHLVVARSLPDGGFEVVTTEKEMVRFARDSGGGDLRWLDPAAIERGLSALARMAEMATSLGADITAVATSAVREAENRAEFVDRARNELGISVDVISGVEEARLIHHGVIHAVPVSDRRVLVIDIGGGSTELVVGEGDELVEVRSVRLGSSRLTERFFALGPDEVADPETVAACRTFLRSSLAPVVRDLGGHRPETAIGSSGTAMSIASMIAARRGAEGRLMNGFVFTADELTETVDQVVSVSANERGRIRGLDEKRVDIVIGGALLLDEIISAFGLHEVTISDYALREGVLFDRFPAGAEHTRNLRRSNAIRLARQLDNDVDHALTTARLALQLFDRTVDLHGLDAHARELLDIGAIVHNVGISIAHSAHHKHSYYLVRHWEQLTGFTEHEIELVAVLARYHRKALPSEKHSEFRDLSPADRYLVSWLAGLLRIAIGLDRRSSGLVTSVGVITEQDDDGTVTSLVIEPLVASGADIGLEIYAANERSELLAQVVGAPVEVRARASD